MVSQTGHGPTVTRFPRHPGHSFSKIAENNARAGSSLNAATNPARASRICPGRTTVAGRGRDFVLFVGCAPQSVELGRHGSRGCCCGCPAYSCYDSPTGNSSGCCSNCRRDSRGSSLRAKPQTFHHTVPEFYRFTTAHKGQQRLDVAGRCLFIPDTLLVVLLILAQFLDKSVSATSSQS